MAASSSLPSQGEGSQREGKSPIHLAYIDQEFYQPMVTTSTATTRRSVVGSWRGLHMSDNILRLLASPSCMDL